MEKRYTYGVLMFLVVVRGADNVDEREFLPNMLLHGDITNPTMVNYGSSYQKVICTRADSHVIICYYFLAFSSCVSAIDLDSHGLYLDSIYLCSCHRLLCGMFGNPEDHLNLLTPNYGILLPPRTVDLIATCSRQRREYFAVQTQISFALPGWRFSHPRSIIAAMAWSAAWNLGW